MAQGPHIMFLGILLGNIKLQNGAIMKETIFKELYLEITKIKPSIERYFGPLLFLLSSY